MRTRWILGVLACSAAAACNGGGGGGGLPPGGPGPTVTAVQPALGFTTGEIPVTITGTGFAAGGTTTVTFGGVAAAGIVVVSDTVLEATAPANAAFGPAEVAVTNADGTGTRPAAFTYVRFPPRPGSADQRLDPGGGTGAFGFPLVCCSGDRVYAVWTDDRVGGGNQDVFVRASADRGVTWGPERRLDTNPAGAANSTTPRICCDGPRVYVVWTDNRNGTYEPFVNRSLDGGATFLPSDVRVGSSAPGSANVQFAPTICCNGATVTISWSDDRNAASPLGATDLFASTSTDGGLTWQASDARLNATATAGTTPYDVNLSTTRMCCSGSTVLVVWSDGRNGDGDVWLQRSANGGATWLPAELRVDRGGSSNARSPRLCCDGAALHIGFVDDRNAASPGAAFDVFVNSSMDAGATLFATDTRVSTAPPGIITAGNIELCCEGDAVYLTWRDNRNGSFGEDVFFNRSMDGGLTFEAADVRVNTGVAPSSAPLSAIPKICCGDGAVYIAWADERNGMSDVFFNASNDGGATWPATDVRLDTDAAGSADSLNVQICGEGPIAHFLWRDARNGDLDLYVNSIVP